VSPAGDDHLKDIKEGAEQADVAMSNNGELKAVHTALAYV
jgi:hypothetical protein